MHRGEKNRVARPDDGHAQARCPRIARRRASTRDGAPGPDDEASSTLRLHRNRRTGDASRDSRTPVRISSPNVARRRARPRGDVEGKERVRRPAQAGRCREIYARQRWRSRRVDRVEVDADTVTVAIDWATPSGTRSARRVDTRDRAAAQPPVVAGRPAWPTDVEDDDLSPIVGARCDLRHIDDETILVVSSQVMTAVLAETARTPAVEARARPSGHRGPSGRRHLACIARHGLSARPRSTTSPARPAAPGRRSTATSAGKQRPRRARPSRARPRVIAAVRARPPTRGRRSRTRSSRCSIVAGVELARTRGAALRRRLRARAAAPAPHVRRRRPLPRQDVGRARARARALRRRRRAAARPSGSPASASCSGSRPTAPVSLLDEPARPRRTSRAFVLPAIHPSDLDLPEGVAPWPSPTRR